MFSWNVLLDHLKQGSIGLSYYPTHIDWVKSYIYYQPNKCSSQEVAYTLKGYCFVGRDFKKRDLEANENLITFGTRGVSEVRGRNNRIGYINVNDLREDPNTAAHEFGHHVGLSDRYNEGVKADAGNGGEAEAWTRGTTAIGGINDPGYNPNTNLMSGPGGGGTPTLTAAQLAIASSPQVEQNYQINGGFIHKRATGGTTSAGVTRYRKILGMTFINRSNDRNRKRGTTRRNIRRAIRRNS